MQRFPPRPSSVSSSRAVSPAPRIHGAVHASALSDRAAVIHRLSLRLQQLQAIARALRAPAGSIEARAAVQIRRRVNAESARTQKELELQKAHSHATPSSSSFQLAPPSMSSSSPSSSFMLCSGNSLRSGGGEKTPAPASGGHWSSEGNHSPGNGLEDLASILGIPVSVLEAAGVDAPRETVSGSPRSPTPAASSAASAASASSTSPSSGALMHNPSQINALLRYIHTTTMARESYAEANNNNNAPSSLSDIQIKTEGLSPHMLASLPCSSLTNTMSDSCSICLEPMKIREKVIVMPHCGHMFHRNCIVTWLSRSPVCPLCKQDVLPPPPPPKKVAPTHARLQTFSQLRERKNAARLQAHDNRSRVAINATHAPQQQANARTRTQRGLASNNTAAVGVAAAKRHNQPSEPFSRAQSDVTQWMGMRP